MRAHNATALHWHRAKRLVGEVHEVHIWHDAPADGPAADAGAAFVKAEGFHELTHIAVGARVIYTVTANKSTGATNSKLAVVTGIELGAAPPEVRLPEGTKWVQSVKLMLLDTGKDATATRSVNKSGYHERCEMRKATFPIQLAYAMTAHRRQALGVPCAGAECELAACLPACLPACGAAPAGTWRPAPPTAVRAAAAAPASLPSVHACLARATAPAAKAPP